MEPILYLLRKKIETLGKGIFIIEGANIVEQNLTSIFNENIISMEISADTQIKRLAEKNFTEEQIRRRIEFQLTDANRLKAIEEKQRKESYRLLIRLNGAEKIEKNAKLLGEKLREEYQKRSKIIR